MEAANCWTALSTPGGRPHLVVAHPGEHHVEERREDEPHADGRESSSPGAIHHGPVCRPRSRSTVNASPAELRRKSTTARRCAGAGRPNLATMPERRRVQTARCRRGAEPSTTPALTAEKCRPSWRNSDSESISPVIAAKNEEATIQAAGEPPVSTSRRGCSTRCQPRRLLLVQPRTPRSRGPGSRPSSASTTQASPYSWPCTSGKISDCRRGCAEQHADVVQPDALAGVGPGQEDHGAERRRAGRPAR